MVWDSYGNIDAKAAEFLTETFNDMFMGTVRDRWYSYKLARFRQKISFVVARALARQRLAYIYGAEYQVYGQSVTIPDLENLFVGDGGVGDDSA